MFGVYFAWNVFYCIFLFIETQYVFAKHILFIIKLPFSVQQIETFMKSMRTQFSKLTDEKNKKSGSGAETLTRRTQWIVRRFEFLRPHIRRLKAKRKVSQKVNVA
jgi:hypothetical protein